MPQGEFWGKFDDGHRKGSRDVDPSWHPLIDHSADVAAITELLLQRTLLGRRLARLGGLERLNEVQVARLGFLAALHDFGKYNVGFQEQIHPGRPRIGHVLPAVELLDWHCRDFRASKALYDALLELEYDGWFETEASAIQMLVATACHHGRPYQGTASQNHRLWQASGGLDPLEGLRSLLCTARAWFPEAAGGADNPVPASAAFQHGWNGLLNLADWLGSDREFFPFAAEVDGDRMPKAREHASIALRAVGLDLDDPKRSLAGRRPSLSEVLGREVSPRPIQEAILQVPVGEEGSVVVAEATTGEGKTEAAILHFLRLFAEGRVEGLYFALPTRAAASQIYGRVHRAVERVFPAGLRPAVLQAIPGYAIVDSVEGRLLPEFQVQWPDDWQEAQRRRAWAAERSKRFLAGPIVVGTVDQVLLSTLSVKHSHLRAAPLLRHLLVVDEVHASDAYMTRILEKVLDHQLAAGGHALLLSATLGGEARERLLRPDCFEAPSLDSCLSTHYPALSWRGRMEPLPVEASMHREVRVQIAPILEDAPSIVSAALDAAARGAHVLVLRNTVTGAVETQQALEELASARRLDHLLFRAAGVAAPHHSRFAAVDRKILDDAVEDAFRPKRKESCGVVVVATQTVEQSLDLDADLLFTDLCPIDVLLQRIGRLHRHEETRRPESLEEARVVVLVPEVRDLSEVLLESGEARGAHGLGSVYPDLRALETTWQQLEVTHSIAIPGNCRRLVETCLHPETLAAVEERGAKWRQHGQKMIGSRLSKEQAADLSVMDWNIPFGELGFSETAESIRTRLGEQEVRLSFEQPYPLGPFGQPVEELSLRHYEVPEGVDLANAVPTVVRSTDENGTEFRFGEQEFGYTRLGVFRVDR